MRSDSCDLSSLVLNVNVWVQENSSLTVLLLTGHQCSIHYQSCHLDLVQASVDKCFWQIVTLQCKGAQYVDRDLTVDLKGTVGRSHDINTLADAIQCKSSEKSQAMRKMYLFNCARLLNVGSCRYVRYINMQCCMNSHYICQ